MSKGLREIPVELYEKWNLNPDNAACVNCIKFLQNNYPEPEREVELSGPLDIRRKKMSS